MKLLLDHNQECSVMFYTRLPCLQLLSRSCLCLMLEMPLVDIPRLFLSLLVQNPDLDSVFDNGKHNNTGIKIRQILCLGLFLLNFSYTCTKLTPAHCIHSLTLLPVEGREME